MPLSATAAGATGTLNVDGGSTWSLPDGVLYVGGNGFLPATAGTGIANVTNGATLAPSSTVIGSSGGTGTMNVDASTLNTGNLFVGNGGTGTFNVTGGSVATISLGQVDLGDCNCSSGTVTVSGTNSKFISTTGNPTFVTIGVGGTGTFNVLDNATATFVADVRLGINSTGSGTLNLQNGGKFTTTKDLTVGSDGTGVVNVSGLGSTLTTRGLFVGDNHGTGIVNITNGGIVNASGIIGLGNNHSDASGTVTVSGGGSQFNSTDGNSGDIAIGGRWHRRVQRSQWSHGQLRHRLFLGFDNGSGTVNVQSGGHFTTTGSLIVGLNGTGAVNVTGGGSQLNVDGGIFIGKDGTGTVNVTNGGRPLLPAAHFSADCFCALGTVTVSGAGSTWASAGATIGGLGTGQFNVLNGASASLGDIFVGTSFGNGTLKIDATSQATGTSYTQGSVGTFAVGISPTGNGKLTVTGGDIDLMDGSLVVSAKTTVAKTYTIMTTNGAVTGTFGSVNIVGNANNLQVIYNPTSVVLTVDTFSVANNLPSGLSGNPKHVADALDKAIASGITIPDAFFNVFALSGDSLVNALSQLSGETAAGAQQSNIQLMNSFLSLMLNPFGGAPSGNPGAIGFAREFGPGDKISPEAAAAYAAVTPKDKRADNSTGRWSVWGQAYGGYNKINGDATTVSHDSAARTYGLATGFDYRASPDTMVGFALAGAGENWGVVGRTRQRPRRRVPARRLRLEAVRRGLPVRRPLLCGAQYHHRPHGDRCGGRPPHRQLHRAERRRPHRDRLPLPHALRWRDALCGGAGAGFLHAELQRERGVGLECLRAVVQFALLGDDAHRARRLVRQGAHVRARKDAVAALARRLGERSFERSGHQRRVPDAAGRCIHGEWRRARDQPGAGDHRRRAAACQQRIVRPQVRRRIRRRLADLCRHRHGALRLVRLR